MAAKNRAFLLLSAIFCLIILVSFYQTPQKISLRTIDGYSLSKVLADRAEISIKVSAEGNKQSKVADQVRQTSEEILNLLRPLTLPPNRTSPVFSSASSSSHLTNLPSSTFLPPIATLSVNTFSSNSYHRPSLIGEKETYRTSIEITAEFRSLTPQDPLNVNDNDANNRTIFPNSGFHHLSLVLPSLAKLPNTQIDYLKWFLSPSYLSTLQSSARQKAMTDVLTKISDFIAPMRLRFPSIECRSFRERQGSRPFERYASLNSHHVEGIRFQEAEALMYHDELDNEWKPRADRLGYEIEGKRKEVLGLEPESLDIVSSVEGEWVVVEKGWVRGVWGMVF